MLPAEKRGWGRGVKEFEPSKNPLLNLARDTQLFCTTRSLKSTILVPWIFGGFEKNIDSRITSRDIHYPLLNLPPAEPNYSQKMISLEWNLRNTCLAYYDTAKFLHRRPT